MNKYINRNPLIVIFMLIIIFCVLAILYSFDNSKNFMFYSKLAAACLTAILAISVLMGKEGFSPVYDVYKNLYSFKVIFNEMNKGKIDSKLFQYYHHMMISSFLKLKSSVLLLTSTDYTHHNGCFLIKFLSNVFNWVMLHKKKNIYRLLPKKYDCNIRKNINSISRIVVNHYTCNYCKDDIKTVNNKIKHIKQYLDESV